MAGAAANPELLSSNRNPLVAIYGLAMPESAQHRQAGNASSVALEMVNVSTQNLSSNRLQLAISGAIQEDEIILLDSELLRAEWRMNFSLGQGRQLGFSLPYLYYGGGMMDAAIERWHDWFSLPNSNRDSRPRNGLRMEYWRDGKRELLFTDSSDGIGDLRLHYRQSLFDQAAAEQETSMTLELAAKLPTGSESALAGSGSTDLSAALRYDRQLPQSKVDLHVSGGLLWMSGDGTLAAFREDVVGYGFAGLRWQYWPAVALKAQLEVHSAFYDSDTRQLGGTAAQLLLGGSVTLNAHSELDLYISEDIVTRSSPDISVGIQFRRRFDQ